MPKTMLKIAERNWLTMNNECFYISGSNTPNIPIVFTERCIGCNTCVENCRTDVLMPNPEKGGHPVVAYPDECWFCGCCTEDCPIDGASIFCSPLNRKVAWKNKETGELHRVVDPR